MKRCLKQNIFIPKISLSGHFVPKNGQNVWLHMCGCDQWKKGPHARTSHTYFRGYFAQTHTCDRTSQPIPCIFAQKSSSRKIFFYVCFSDFRKGCQKVLKFTFQSQLSMSKIIWLFSDFVFHLKKNVWDNISWY
jgi:hypothetical protein